MKNLLKKGKKIFLVPKDIKGALSTDIKKLNVASLELQIDKEDMEYYKVGDTVEMFTVVNDGMLYFHPTVKETDEENNVIKIKFDKKNYELLQRREFTRAEYEKEFILKDGDNTYACKGIDLSAGGMRFVTASEISTLKDYPVEFKLEASIPINCFFKPIRVDKGKADDGKNIVSGRFIALKNIDKIAIVQFSFKKEMENTNK